MIDTFRNIFKIADLRKRILFTVMILGIARIGTHIVTPGIDTAALANIWQNAQNTVFGLYDLFAGGAFSKAAVFGLGIMPYISASIIFQLLGAVWPAIQRLQQSGEEGRKKITQYTRYATLALSAMQAFGVAVWLESQNVVIAPGFGFKLITMISMATGTMLLMWLGEQIDDRGIGNGISLLIMVGIMAGFPGAVNQEIAEFMNDNRTLLQELFLIVIAFFIIAFVVALTQGQRKIPVQYAKRVVGRKVYGGVNTHFPLRVNTAGVMPIIFAQAIMFIPNTFFSFFPESETMIWLQALLNFDSVVYWIIYGLIIVFFTYFYTAIILNPVEVADNLKKQGGFIPGVRPGKKTAEYLDNILTRVTLPGSIALAFVAIIPYILIKFFNVSFGYASFFGGTGLLIIVGVALDFIQQVESHLYMRHYEGFSRGGRIRGRR
ncbi:MAG: preprotein translocase subunit SecY [Calditrichaeota bacterium]|nr:preprotein translocase subunit SecY [Calditrichota bacterium]MCB0295899.1 preprotein translocase subunit SecY [Calditrichota bacterium]MCB0302725.1 preprotein translocase subunit SecY [Calditrichota bacterium]MCB0312406.1 preprotein translocase subunit SecY [Calditrichota bacterium]MCB9087231.1 preprotein translocase subunit SecY [Calditrichia bacterium]